MVFLQFRKRSLCLKQKNVAFRENIPMGIQECVISAPYRLKSGCVLPLVPGEREAEGEGGGSETPSPPLPEIGDFYIKDIGDSEPLLTSA